MSVPAVAAVKQMPEVQERTPGLMTREMFEQALPKRIRANVTDEVLKEINAIIQHSDQRENYRENLLTYTGVLKEGMNTLSQYANAVRYVSHKLTGDSNQLAFLKTFPDKYQRMLDNGWNEKDIRSRISGYHRTQLVTAIMEKSLVPSWILNQDMYQKALNASADLMMNARSEKVRCDAANNLLSHLKMPETQKVELDIGVKEDDSISELRKVTLELVKQQKKMIQAGAMSAGEIAKQKVVAGEVVSEQ